MKGRESVTSKVTLMSFSHYACVRIDSDFVLLIVVFLSPACLYLWFHFLKILFHSLSNQTEISSNLKVVFLFIINSIFLIFTFYSMQLKELCGALNDLLLACFF